jgi:RNA polymerase sigma-70 factor, ECF subfamily
MVKKGGDTVLTEPELIKRAKAGDEECFAGLAEAYSGRIYNTGLRMLGNNEDAADMTQEVLLKIYRHLGNFRGDSAFSTWVYRITVNSCRDFLRTAYRRKELIFTDFGEDGESEEDFHIADFSAIPEAVYLQNECENYLAELINGLSPKYRIVIVLREISGLSYQEIAAAVDISIGTVKSRISRARAALADKLASDREHYPHLSGLISIETRKEAVK